MRVRTPRSRVALTTCAVSVAALSLGLAATANAASAKPADTGARAGDVVGVGSDTVQNAADFMFDNSYNAGGNLNRIFDFNATGDANGRAEYDGTCGTDTPTSGTNAYSNPATVCNTGNAAAPTVDSNANLLNTTVILRAGTNPVVRPNGSGAGILALYQDSPGGTTTYEGLPDGSIQYARASRLPNSTEEGTTECSTSSACEGLHVYQFATDNLQIAHVATGYDGPAGLSLADLVQIYLCNDTTWSQIPGYTGSHGSATIHPLIPQTGSGTRNFFLTDLGAADGLGANTQLQPGTCARTVEEHDPSGIYADPSPADAIEPFSTGKISLINSGYFTNGNVSVAGGKNNHTQFTKGFLTTDPANAVADAGTSSQTTAYSSTRGLYFIVRQEDESSTTPFQPGETTNYIQDLFAGSGSGATAVQPLIAQSTVKNLIKAAGFTQAYKDCGINPTAC